MLVLSAVEWQRWRAELLRMSNPTEAALECRLDVLESQMRVSTSDAVGNDTLRRPCECDAPCKPPHVETKDATTQLFTLQNVCLSRYVLRLLCAELSLRALARQLGRLAAQLHTLSADYLHSLSCLFTHHATCQTSSSSSNATCLPLPRHESSVTALCVLLPDDYRSSATADEARDRLVEWLQKEQSSADVTPARFDVAVQTDVPMTRSTMPFLCRRCRRDGRGEYVYDRQGRQLQRLVNP